MHCPRCGHENAQSSTFCEQCNSPLSVTEVTLEQAEYKAPPPSLLNGHKKLSLAPPSLPSPPPEYDQVVPLAPPVSPPSSYPQSVTSTRIGIFSGVLYFIGTIIAIVGLLGAITTLGSGTGIGLLGLLLTLIVMTISIVFFVRLRNRAPILRWWQRIMWIVGATLATFLALILEVIVSPHSLLTLYYTAFVLLLYGLSWTAIALW
ncbi:MAG: zinc ribbon domain-containing protein [Chloroflexota bacterium]|nr:zinc ribbon domain-containing protein [Chloroflexota bacterium]